MSKLTSGGVGNFFGTWPGDETDAELQEGLHQIRHPEATASGLTCPHGVGATVCIVCNGTQPVSLPSGEAKLPPLSKRCHELTDDLGSEGLDPDVRIRMYLADREFQLSAALAERDAAIKQMNKWRGERDRAIQFGQTMARFRKEAENKLATYEAAEKEGKQ